MPTLATSVPSVNPMTVPATSAAPMAAYQGAPVQQRDREDGGADAAGVAGRQVDLTEQQHEDEAHRDDRDGRALGQQVGEVAGGQEHRAQDR
jgi:hypothetical protein